MWTISFIKLGMMKTEYMQHREIMVKYKSRAEEMFRKMDEAVVPEGFGKRAIGFGGVIAMAITDIRGQVL